MISKDLIVLVLEEVHLYRGKNPLVMTSPHHRGQKNLEHCWICLGQPLHEWLQGPNAADRAQEEVIKYREVTPVPLSEDPLKWCTMDEVCPISFVAFD
ncbi:hypothetical protein PHYPO_G00221770 [Pangasianodon hypophthalmus]|uniref:Uncharacterized protein n=1 Tax=Pangasianodon hypophthalmus TaxID=310915 RepID=A0A5N5NUT5_PANHP|nr:hypothetical protein PHYPO_G00221770 [Pangasianodon hypophthalmus]